MKPYPIGSLRHPSDLLAIWLPDGVRIGWGGSQVQAGFWGHLGGLSSMRSQL